MTTKALRRLRSMVPNETPDNDLAIIALGGSIIVPDDINANFLKEFRKFVLKLLKKGKRFVIVAGGGKIARDYQNAASYIVKLSDEDKDWLGIHSTRLNAHLLRAIFFDVAYPVVLNNPLREIKNGDRHNLFIAGGWRPGWSTDYVAVVLAARFNTKKVIIATKISHVYDDDIEKNSHAKPFEELSWKEYRKMVGSTWTPGMKSPVDPIAAKLAESLKIEAVVVLGRELENLENVVLGKKFQGTIIH